MKQFIEIPRKGDKVLINVNQIFLVEKTKEGCRIALSIKGFNNYPFQYIDTAIEYEQVMKLIEDSP